MFGRATIRLGIGPHSSLIVVHCLKLCDRFTRYQWAIVFRIFAALLHAMKYILIYGRRWLLNYFCLTYLMMRVPTYFYHDCVEIYVVSDQKLLRHILCCLISCKWQFGSLLYLGLGSTSDFVPWYVPWKIPRFPVVQWCRLLCNVKYVSPVSTLSEAIYTKVCDKQVDNDAKPTELSLRQCIVCSKLVKWLSK